MPNVPSTLQLPTVAVAPARALEVETRGLQEGQGPPRDAGSFPVLAIGWYGEQSGMSEEMAYLVFDRLRHDVFWVGESLVEKVTAA